MLRASCAPAAEPGNEIELYAKTAGEIVGALADESGVLKPTQQLGEMVAMRLHYRHYPKVVERALAASEKIKRSGLPRRAYEEIPDPLLRAILVGAAEDVDPTMQARWENLLANALTVGSVDVTNAFVRVLDDLEPAEAAQLDAWADATGEHGWQHTRFPLTDARLGMPSLDHLVGLGLVEFPRSAITLPGFVNIDRGGITEVVFTAFGWGVRASLPRARSVARRRLTLDVQARGYGASAATPPDRRHRAREPCSGLRTKAITPCVVRVRAWRGPSG